jgi:hypothetical protein
MRPPVKVIAGCTSVHCSLTPACAPAREVGPALPHASCGPSLRALPGGASAPGAASALGWGDGDLWRVLPGAGGRARCAEKNTWDSEPECGPEMRVSATSAGPWAADALTSRVAVFSYLQDLREMTKTRNQFILRGAPAGPSNRQDAKQPQESQDRRLVKKRCGIMAQPPRSVVKRGDCTGFVGRWNYPQPRGTRPPAR